MPAVGEVSVGAAKERPGRLASYLPFQTRRIE